MLLRSLLTVAILAPAAALAVELEGVVTEVKDGDSVRLVTLKESYDIRLLYIDAPEKAQAYGQDSRTSLRHMCLLKKATVETSGEDRYGRTLGFVRCAGVDVQEEQVRRGMAWVFDRFARKNSPLYGVQAEARASRRGLWDGSNPESPWEYRRARKLKEAQ